MTEIDSILSFWRNKSWVYQIRNVDQGVRGNFVTISVLENMYCSRHESNDFTGKTLLEAMKNAHDWAASKAYNGQGDPRLEIRGTAESDDLSNADKEFLIEEVLHLRNAIRQHRNEKGHNRCWMDDDHLYHVLPERESAITHLPPKEEWMTNCKIYCDQYWENRQRMFPLNSEEKK